jgi:hypothetical protein
MEFPAPLEDGRNTKRPRMESDTSKLVEQERISDDVLIHVRAVARTCY